MTDLKRFIVSRIYQCFCSIVMTLLVSLFMSIICAYFEKGEPG